MIPAVAADPRVPTGALRDALESRLGARVLGIERRPSPYASSHPLEELDVDLEGGGRLALVFKDCGRTVPGARPALVDDPLRPIAIYRALLPFAPPGPPRCVAALGDAVSGRRWLFLERVEGPRLAFVGDFESWRAAARWLAALHARFLGRTDAVAAGRLLVHDPALADRWMQRARAAHPDEPRLARIAARLYQPATRLAALPPTLLHGEFYADNVLVAPGREGPRICPVDWESAGWGPGVLDLAALVSGSWDERRRRDLALAYRAALEADAGVAPDPDRLLADLDLARLHVAVQWLGWLGRREPPPWQRHDWLGEAIALGERVAP